MENSLAELNKIYGSNNIATQWYRENNRFESRFTLDVLF